MKHKQVKNILSPIKHIIIGFYLSDVIVQIELRMPMELNPLIVPMMNIYLRLQNRLELIWVIHVEQELVAPAW